MSSIRVDISRALQQMTQVEQRTLYACLIYGRAAANKMVKDAKIHAPWQDRTPLARPSLNGEAREIVAGQVRVELAHGVYYGIYLELVRFKYKGNLAIVFPTVKKMAPEIIQGWAKIANKGGR